MSSKSLTPAHITTGVPAIPPDLAAAVDRVNSYHAACLKSFGDQMGYAFLAGRELLALKDHIAHGHFTKFRELHFPKLPERSAQRYMAFADALSKSATVADLPAAGNTRLLTNGSNGDSLTQKQKEQILQAVHEVADGKTLTQLYRDLEVIRDAKPPKGTGRKAKIDLDGGGADDGSFLTELRQDMLLLCHEEDRSLQEADTAALLKFREAYRALGHRLDAVLKRRKNAG